MAAVMQLMVLGGCGAWPEPGQPCSGFLVEHDGFRLVIDLDPRPPGARLKERPDEPWHGLALKLRPGVCRDPRALPAVYARGCIAKQASGNTGRMVDDAARNRAIYHALKAADEVAAALQAHLIEEHGADPDRTAAQSPATNPLKLLRQARERLGEGLRAVEAGDLAESDQISLRNR